MEIYKKYRPAQFKDVVGQDDAVKTLTGFLKKKEVPHAMMFSGPPGCGKNTLTRILRTEMNCTKSDYEEVDCAAVDKMIGMVRRIKSRMMLAPMHGDCRIYMLDEVQSLSRTKFAQQALLKTLEDTPNHVYFMLATTEPDKVIKAVRSRCTSIKVSSLDDSSLETVINKVLTQEKREISDEVMSKIVHIAGGSPRNALVLLEQVLQFEDEEEQLNSVLASDTEREAFDIVRKLLYQKVKWPEMARTIKAIDKDPEEIRRLVLACTNTEILKGGKSADRAYFIIMAFESPFYDSGRAGLSRACYEVLNHK